MAGSGVVSHSTRSKWAIRGPAEKLGVPSRGDVCLEFCIDIARAGHAFGGEVAERAAADHFVQARAGGGLGQALRHDDGHRVGRMGERVGEQGERAAEAEADGAVVGGVELGGGGGERLAEGVVDPPALDAGDGVAGEDLGAVVEA